MNSSPTKSKSGIKSSEDPRSGPSRKPSKNSHSKQVGDPRKHVHGPGCNHGHDICEIAIRKYAAADFMELTAVWKASDIKLNDTDTSRAIEQSFKRNGNCYRIFVAEAKTMDADDNVEIGKPRIAGGVVITFDGHHAYVYHLAVHPEFRNVGLGRALLDTCERQAKLWGARHMRLTARMDSSRAAAHRIYKATGWSVDDAVCVYRKMLKTPKGL